MRLDLLHLSRSVRRSPASAAAAVLTLSLTVGASASIFAVVDAVLLTPPPFTNPDALVTVGETPIDQPALGGQAHTLVGVLPDRFFFALNECEVWRPLPVTPAQAARTGYRVGVIARLAANASPSDLAAALDDVSRTSSPPARVVATPVATAIAGDSRRTLGLLAGAAALAMLIAFTNVAGLLIVRSIDRRRELAVRCA